MLVAPIAGLSAVTSLGSDAVQILQIRRAFWYVWLGAHLSIILVATIKYQAKASPSVQPPTELQYHTRKQSIICDALQCLEVDDLIV